MLAIINLMMATAAAKGQDEQTLQNLEEVLSELQIKMSNGESIEELRNWHKAVMEREARLEQLIEAQKKQPNIGAQLSAAVTAKKDQTRKALAQKDKVIEQKKNQVVAKINEIAAAQKQKVEKAKQSQQAAIPVIQEKADRAKSVQEAKDKLVKIMNQKNADLNRVMTKASNKAQAALAKLQVPAKSAAKETAPNAVKTAPQPAAPIPAQNSTAKSHEGPFMILYQKNQGRNEWVSFDAETDALKMYSAMEKLGWTSAMYSADMQLIKNAGHMPAQFKTLADKASQEKFHYFTSAFDENAPYFVGWLGKDTAINGQVFITYEDADIMMKSMDMRIPHAVYDINASRLDQYGIDDWERVDNFAKQKLMPFQLDSVLLTMIANMNDRQLETAQEKFAPGDAPMLTNLKRRVVKDDAVAPFILVWQRYEGLTESNLFTNKPDALREFTWMKMLGRDVALYDFESSLLEKSADEDLIFEFDAFAENQIAIGRDWADEVDGNAPYTVVWQNHEGLQDGETFIVHYNALEQWKAIIDHTEFPVAIFDARGQMVGNYEGYDNFGNTEWDLLRGFAMEHVQPFLDVPRDWEYVSLRNEDLTNLEYIPKEEMEVEIDAEVLSQNFELSESHKEKVNLAALFEDPSKFNAELLSYDDDWSIFW